MKVFKLIKCYSIFVFITTSLLLGQKQHSFFEEQPTPFRTNTVSVTRNQGIFMPELSGTIEQMALQFLGANAKTFQMQPMLDDLVLSTIKESPGGFHVRFYQKYMGIPVWNSNTVISFNHGSKIMFFMIDYHPDVSLDDITPSLTKENALTLAEDAISSSQLYDDPSVELMVLPLEDYYLLGYRVMLPSMDF
ncbi:MAG: hypothetical protein ACETWG_06610 [Candidatus Neomarinimicrobiota bacterium]